jgi:hypothetical protein
VGVRPKVLCLWSESNDFNQSVSQALINNGRYSYMMRSQLYLKYYQIQMEGVVLLFLVDESTNRHKTYTMRMYSHPLTWTRAPTPSIKDSGICQSPGILLASSLYISHNESGCHDIAVKLWALTKNPIIYTLVVIFHRLKKCNFQL